MPDFVAWFDKAFIDYGFLSLGWPIAFYLFVKLMRQNNRLFSALSDINVSLAIISERLGS